MIFKKEQTRGELDGFLDAGSHVVGELRFQDTFRIDGRLEGSIQSEGNLVIGENGHVEGEIQVRQVYVAGVVRGTIREAHRVEIGATGKVYGDLQTESLVLEDGAFFQGRSTMEKPGAMEPDKVAKLLLELPEDEPLGAIDAAEGGARRTG